MILKSYYKITLYFDMLLWQPLLPSGKVDFLTSPRPPNLVNLTSLLLLFRDIY
jgi:hypothetical protein